MGIAVGFSAHTGVRLVGGNQRTLSCTDIGRPARLPWHLRGSVKLDALERWGVWAVLALVSVAGTAHPAIPVAVSDPPLAVGAAAVSTVVGAALVQLEVLRFRAFGRPLDLLVGVGFGMSALANLLMGVVIPGTAAGMGMPPLETVTVLALVSRGLGSIVFGLAVLQSRQVLLATQRDQVAAFGMLAGLLSVVVVSTLAFWFAPLLPPAFDSQTRADLATGRAVSDPLAGQAAWLLVCNAALVTLHVVAMYRLMILAKRLVDAYLGLLALGIGLLGLSQVQMVLFPSGAPGYIGFSDVFRLAAYLVLLFGLVSRVTDDLAERASAEERLRLSREMHDGLAQQLSSLNLRLSQAIQACPDSAASSLRSNLQTSRRLAQSALLEARHAITALRTDTIAWENFVEALEAYCNESSQNHAVELELRVEGTLPALRAELQVEVLRILNEAISNAVRHGEAARIEVGVIVDSRLSRLRLTIQDDGRGLVSGELPPCPGVGLRSLAERMERRGGVLLLQSNSSDSTLLEIALPFKLRNGCVV